MRSKSAILCENLELFAETPTHRFDRTGGKSRNVRHAIRKQCLAKVSQINPRNSRTIINDKSRHGR